MTHILHQHVFLQGNKIIIQLAFPCMSKPLPTSTAKVNLHCFVIYTDVISKKTKWRPYLI